MALSGPQRMLQPMSSIHRTTHFASQSPPLQDLLQVVQTSPPSPTDPSALFIQALRQSFGDKMAAAIARELNLSPAGGHCLRASDIDRAVEIGEVARLALQGVDFATRLQQQGGLRP